MGHVIAVSGKGGVGKTTLCGLLIQYLCENGKHPVLAVDADANANLNEVLGVEPEITLGELREEIERAGVDPRYQIPAGMTKQAYLEMRLSDAIAEEDDYDLMVMGRTQGQVIWNCQNTKGVRVASGIYLVLSATEDSKESVVTKIAVIK